MMARTLQSVETYPPSSRGTLGASGHHDSSDTGSFGPFPALRWDPARLQAACSVEGGPSSLRSAPGMEIPLSLAVDPLVLLLLLFCAIPLCGVLFFETSSSSQWCFPSCNLSDSLDNIFSLIVKLLGPHLPGLPPTTRGSLSLPCPPILSGFLSFVWVFSAPWTKSQKSAHLKKKEELAEAVAASEQTARFFSFWAGVWGGSP